jgi:two-component system, OmpR family, sensor kinase
VAERVLIVEDDSSVRRMLERSLAAEGFEVGSAVDGGAALAMAEASAPDLVVLDVAMPGLSGVDVCRRLRGKGLSGGILMLTAPGGVALVAAGTGDIDDTLHQLTVLLLLCGAVAVLAGGLAAALLTRRSVRPLRELASSATRIEQTGDASRRLAEPASPEEIGELARTLNAMLAALERARERERRFLADASHELRTPLTALIGNVDFLARHGAGAEVIADLQGDAERLRRLVDDLLVLERETGAAAPGQPVRLERTVAEVSAGRADVITEIAAPATVVGEPDALARSFENLLENAAVHGPRGGRITISLRVAGGQAEVAVSDEGAGFPPGSEEDAFERFWRAEEARGRSGSGIGLAIVRATAERHGGAVRAEGSTVTVTLPVVSPAPAAGEPGPPLGSNGGRRG